MPKIIENKIRDVKFGVKCKIIQPVNLYECKLEIMFLSDHLLRFVKMYRLEKIQEFQVIATFAQSNHWQKLLYRSWCNVY